MTRAPLMTRAPSMARIPPMTNSEQPQDVGILALQIYIPTTFVAQEDLEIYDGVTSGKYTVGLGQEAMSFVRDNEDVNSMCMTVMMQLLERHNIDISRIGRLEVGTETIQDKAKSVKSYLMQLFPEHADICGVDNLNACYGGTAALLNSVAWIESRDWDGRLALVVAGDIAIYEKGPARPTGGAGAVAILIGPNAPLILERGTTAHYMQHAFDFYKPNPACEYPLVDGQTSISCYLRALDSCYNLHLDKIAKRTGESVDLSHFDHFVFHCPYGKLVRKSLGRLLFNDALREPSSYPDLAPYCDAIIESTYNSRELDKVLAESSADIFDKKTLPGRLIPSQVGNSYCASVYAGLISLLANLQSSSSIGLRIGIFSYGSGLAASLFSLQIIGDLDGLVPNSVEIGSILSERIRVSPKEFDDVLLRRESLYCAKDWTPSPPTELRQGTFYLSRVDKEYRRHYNRL